MLLKEVESSSLKFIGYESDEELLGIVLKSLPDVIYYYKGVPKNIYFRLNNAKSKGKFFVKEIKNTFSFTKIKK